MAKTKISELDAAAANNTDINSVDVSEGCAPSGINNAIREMGAMLKRMDNGTDHLTNPNITGDLDVDNININGNSITSTDTNGDIVLDPNGSGKVDINGNLDVDGGTIKLDGNYPTGTHNVALGDTALDDGSLSGASNTAIGSNVLSENEGGTRNTGVGHNALAANTSGNYNVAVGYTALDANTTGASNVAIGDSSLTANTTASYNTAVGYRSLAANTSGATNVSVGGDSMLANTTGSNNVSLGVGAMVANTTGGNNVAIGRQALDANTTASNNTAVGYQALTANTTGTGNVAVGQAALDANTTANYNVAVGLQAASANTTAAGITAVGYNALLSNTTGANNTAVGRQTLDANTTGENNVALGQYALGANTTANNNTAVGHQALTANTTGADNTAVGKNAGEALTTPNQNCLIGSGAGKLITTGANNTVIGGYTGNQGGLDIRTASNRIVLSDGDGNPRLISTNAGHIIINETAQNLGQGGGWGQIAVEANATNIHAGKFGGQGTGTTTSVVAITCPRSSGSGFSFLEAFSGMTDVSATGDREFVVRGDGNVAADDSFNGGGADYAEFFEWNDGNTTNEDRRGYSVVLVNNKVRKATASDAAEDIIGVVSATPTVVGDAAWNRWNEKYLRDDYGSYLTETYTVTRWTEVRDDEDDIEHDYPTDEIPSDLTVPSDATVHTQDENGVTFTRRRLNPDYDATQSYTPREERQEWDTIGLMGKLRLRAGQPTGDRWIKMRDVATDNDGNVTVEEWLVR